MTTTLHGRLAATASAHPGRTAAVDSFGNSLTYDQLARMSSAIAGALAELGAGPADRVGIYLPKSVGGVAAIYGVLELGACYVPLDIRAPVARNAFVLRDCDVAAVVVDERRAAELRGALGDAAPPLFVVPEPAALDRIARSASRDVPAADVGGDDLAYLLYTSGTTGRPKGVKLSHRNALAFVDWCLDAFEPTPDDRFVSLAAFNFDLSIHDLFVPASCGASVAIVGEDVALHPRRLVPFVAEQAVSVWYSVPSALILMLDHGDLAHHDFSRLRIVSFAGEVFPVPKLRALTETWPHPRYFNLYGPTETNVCTFFEIVGPVPADRRDPYPIGHPCSGAKTRVVGPDGRQVPRGSEGELWVAGPSVTSGYWRRPELDGQVFVVDGPDSWYRTGDIVVDTDELGYLFRGRRDRMVKRKGYRIELGEIEAALHRHPAIREAAVVSVVPEGADAVVLRAFIATDGTPPSALALREFCARELPAYMIPDDFSSCDQLPRTSTGKVDLQTLHRTATAGLGR